MKQFRNENGVTLVEVLLAMTILAIILISIMMIFPQMGMMNNHNKEKTQGIITAKESLIKWQEKNDIKQSLYLLNKTGHNSLSEHLIKCEDKGDRDDNCEDEEDKNYFLFEEFYKGYNIKVKIYEKPDVSSTEMQAHRIHLELLKTKKVTETYGYVIAEAGDSD